jgi:hypothetical protein
VHRCRRMGEYVPFLHASYSTFASPMFEAGRYIAFISSKRRSTSRSRKWDALCGGRGSKYCRADRNELRFEFGDMSGGEGAPLEACEFEAIVPGLNWCQSSMRICHCEFRPGDPRRKLFVVLVTMVLHQVALQTVVGHGLV